MWPFTGPTQDTGSHIRHAGHASLYVIQESKIHFLIMQNSKVKHSTENNMNKLAVQTAWSETACGQSQGLQEQVMP